MLKRLLIAALLLAPVAALADTQSDLYLPQPDAATALARTRAEAQAMGVLDPTVGWWGIAALPYCTGGITTFIRIEAASRGPGYDFTANPVGPHGSTGITNSEIPQLLTFTQMQSNGCFPAP